MKVTELRELCISNTTLMLWAEEAAYLPRDKILYIATGSQGEGRAALMRIAMDQHSELALEEGTDLVARARLGLMFRCLAESTAVLKLSSQVSRYLAATTSTTAAPHRPPMYLF